MTGPEMDKLCAGTPVTTDNITLLPIERLFIKSGKINWGFQLVAGKEPYAIILQDSQGIRAFDMAGHSVSLESLLEDLPALADFL